jgi:hypothetical protein
MDTKNVKVGMEVTWGTGNIRGEVTLPPFDNRNPETGNVEPFLRVSLTQPYKAPCGHRFPKGTILTVPVSEARSLS